MYDSRNQGVYGTMILPSKLEVVEYSAEARDGYRRAITIACDFPWSIRYFEKRPTLQTRCCTWATSQAATTTVTTTDFQFPHCDRLCAFRLGLHSVFRVHNLKWIPQFSSHLRTRRTTKKKENWKLKWRYTNLYYYSIVLHVRSLANNQTIKQQHMVVTWTRCYASHMLTRITVSLYLIIVFLSIVNVGFPSRLLTYTVWHINNLTQFPSCTCSTQVWNSK